MDIKILSIKNAPPPAKNIPLTPGSIMMLAMDATAMIAIIIQRTLNICFFVAIFLLLYCNT